jgi:hypothetical protein
LAKAATTTVEAPPAVVEYRLVADVVLEPVWHAEAPALDPSPPPVYLSLLNLRL